MPFVTDEIYNEITGEEITISDYPTYEKRFIFKEEEQEGNNLLEFVKTFRNIKQENNIGKDYQVYFETSIPNIALQLLKLEEKIITNPIKMSSYPVTSKPYKAIIFYEKEETIEDKELKQKQIKILQASIERRTKLLANKNYIQKAPTHLVEEEKQKLKEEQEKLVNLL